MKKPQVSFSFPAKAFDFASTAKEKGSNEMFSRGKLKVFYKGETADHRYFSDEFSNELIKSLPYTPIVSYYDTEKKDFKGHAEHQAIYGIVDPKGKIGFETDDQGVEWAVCDTIYYTERPDEVGEIAKQIEGHSQSLELADAKYVVNYDERRHFKNIEFTGGKFVGVSVLGNDQKPAFTGSSFFAAAITSDEEFAKKMKILKDFAERETNGQKENVSNGGQMKITNYEDFMKLSWGDISSKVNEAICSEYGNEAYTCIADMDNDFAYVVFYSYVDGKQSTYKIAYSVSEDGNVTLGAVTPVHREWVDDPVPEAKTEATAAAQETPNAEEGTSAEGQSSPISTTTTAAESKASTEEAAVATNTAATTTTEEGSNTSENEAAATTVTATAGEVASTKVEETASDTAQPKVETAQVQTDNGSVEGTSTSSSATPAATDEASISPSAEVTAESQNYAESQPSQLSNASEVSGTEDGHENVNDDLQEENPSTSTLTDSERAEFEALKLQEKVHLIESYKDKISEDDFANFSKNVASYESDDKLELELLRAFKANEEKKAKEQAERESTNSYNRAVFASLLTATTAIANKESSADDDDSWVAKHR